MARYLRPLALLNVALAVAFLTPLGMLELADSMSRGTLVFAFPKPDPAAQPIVEIKAAVDIEQLRQRATVLAEAHEADVGMREADSLMMARLLDWFLLATAFSGAAFLLNSVALLWIAGRPKARAGAPLSGGTK